MNENLNNNKKNKEINWSNLRIQLRIQLRSLELHECKIKREKYREEKREKEIRSP